jgi:hypothetical protein
MRKWQNPGQQRWYEANSGNCPDCGVKLKTPHSKRCRSCAKKGTRNPLWQKGSANTSTHYYRARAANEQQPCAQCHNPDSEIHHRDGNPLNNAPENIKWLCHPCHMAEHARKRQRH